MRKFKFVIQGNNYEVEIKSIEEEVAKVEVNGTDYAVEIQRSVQKPKTPTLVRPAVKPPEEKPKEAVSGNARATAPLPGNILQVIKNEGDTVKKGDLVIMYEAMKMENKVLAERDGVIRNMTVSPGDTFLQGDVLFEIE